MKRDDSTPHPRPFSPFDAERVAPDGAQGLRRPTRGDAALWQSLEQVRGLCGATVTWKRRLGDSFEPFASAFLRRLEEKAESIWCEECYCAHAVITHPDGKIVGVCECDPWNCDDMQLSADDVALWELNWTKLSRAVARAFDCEWKESELASSGARQIGTFGGVGLPVILCIAHERMEFRGIVAELAARMRDGFVLFAPTTAFVDLHSKELLSHARAAFFDLASHVILWPNGTLRASRSGGELFSALVAKQKPIEENIASQLFGMVKALESERPVRKAPILQVFRLYCMEGLSREEVAARCGCAESLVTLRLQSIEAKLGRAPRKLRQLSSHFERVAESLTDERARRVHRTSALDQPEDPEFA